MWHSQGEAVFQRGGENTAACSPLTLAFTPLLLKAVFRVAWGAAQLFPEARISGGPGLSSDTWHSTDFPSGGHSSFTFE